MLSPHLRKFSDLYTAYGLGAVKNIWLITCLIPLARTANLNKKKGYMGTVLDNGGTKPSGHHKRLVGFFPDWCGKESLPNYLLHISIYSPSPHTRNTPLPKSNYPASGSPRAPKNTLPHFYFSPKTLN